MAEQTDTQAEQFDGGQEATQGGGEQDALLSHLQELSAKVDTLIPQQQGPSFSDLSDPGYDPYGGYEEPELFDGYDQADQYQQAQYADGQQQGQSQQDALQWIQQQINEGVQQAVTPFMAQQRARELENQYPDLKRPEVIQQIAPEAQRLAQTMGLGPDGWRNPDFLAMVYQAQQAQQAASQQIAPEDQQFDQQGFEGGGAGAPGAEEPNLAERILAAYPHGGAHAFWGA